MLFRSGVGDGSGLDAETMWARGGLDDFLAEGERFAGDGADFDGHFARGQVGAGQDARPREVFLAELGVGNGAVELAPALGLCRRIVDLVASGRTLRENGLVEVEHIADVTTRFAVNRSAFKTRSEQLGQWLERFRAAAGLDAQAA